RGDRRHRRATPLGEDLPGELVGDGKGTRPQFQAADAAVFRPDGGLAGFRAFLPGRSLRNPAELGEYDAKKCGCKGSIHHDESGGVCAFLLFLIKINRYQAFLKLFRKTVKEDCHKIAPTAT